MNLLPIAFVLFYNNYVSAVYHYFPSINLALHEMCSLLLTISLYNNNKIYIQFQCEKQQNSYSYSYQIFYFFVLRKKLRLIIQYENIFFVSLLSTYYEMRFYLITIIYYDQRRHIIEEETLTGHKKIGSKDAMPYERKSSLFNEFL